MKYVPRNDYVVIRLRQKPITDGIVYPSNSPESKEYVVHAVGPDVEYLEVGDIVQVIGQYKVDWDFLPGVQDLFVTKEQFIPIVYQMED